MWQSIFIFLILTCTACTSYRRDPWKPTDSGLLIGGLVLKSIDYTQTSRAVGDPRYEEINPVLGPHPSHSQVNLYFASSAIIQIVAVYFLPEKWRRAWLGGWIGISGTNIMYNHHEGLGP